MRTIIVGDIHGCFRELKELLKKMEFREAKDRLISLGDLMDRGKHSYEVFDFFRRRKLKMGDRCILVRGNHEQMLLSCIEDKEALPLWYENGGRETIKSFKSHGDRVKPHKGWFEKNTQFYVEEGNFRCVHAGLVSENLEENDRETFLWDRMALMSNHYQGKLAIVGHTPLHDPVYMDGMGGEAILLDYRVKKRMPRTGIICIDTGCVFKGKLTAMAIEGDGFYLESVACEEGPAGFWQGIFAGKGKGTE